MEKLKNKKKTIGISPLIYDKIKKYCSQEGYIIGTWVEKELNKIVDKK